MSSTTYSTDIWDYLGDMPYVPSRRDRDELRALTANNPKHEKRIHIWDYFFHIRPADVGKPQLQEIDALTRDKDRQVAEIRAKARQQSQLTGGVALVAGIGSFIAFVIKVQPVELALFGIMVLALVGLGIVWQGSRRDVSKAIRNWNANVRMLQKQITLLQRQIPEPATVDQMRRWLDEDIEWLAQHALEQTGLDKKRIPLIDDTPNPICIIGPAYLQRSKSIPELLLDPREVDRSKHMSASSLDFFSDKRFIDLYGVYYVEFFIVTDEVLGNYGCFWDFISGKIYNEHTSEMYYNDVVALTTRQQFRKVDLSFFKMNLENAPTFSLSLSSSDSIQVTYASSEYIKNWFRMKMLDPNGEFGFELKNWVRNPEVVAEKAIQALRMQLRRHKGNGAESPAAEAQ